ncbi:MAG: cellulase family glycosylhydrolase [Bryobacterales bacterium]|nr:cellulase family glycosylhydrolase [Bryobacterales bacterium]
MSACPENRSIGSRARDGRLALRHSALLLALLCGGWACQQAEPGGERAEVPQPSPKAGYWNTPRHGANCFNREVSQEWLDAAAQAGIGMVRLAYGKWPSDERDFLLGDAGQYAGLVAADLARLVETLDAADALGIKVVVTPLSLPGARYRQFNEGERDGRLWTDPAYTQQAAAFWQDLASELEGHPAVAAYDLLNEPNPEWFYGKRSFWDAGFGAWYEQVRGGPGDLNRLHREVAAAIRHVDADTPLIVESGLYATPWAFEYLDALEDDNVLYSFHMYEPYSYTTHRINDGRFTYPGTVFVEDAGQEKLFDSEALDAFFDPVRAWAARNRVLPSRIIVGEFGCDRRVAGARGYLADLISIFNREGWHWAFYSFREDTWDAMDYELGTGGPGQAYWDAAEAGSLPANYARIYGRLSENPLWEVFRSALRPADAPPVGETR